MTRCGGTAYRDVYKLKPDMVTLDCPPSTIALKDHREGIVVFKRGGKYYFMWSIDCAHSPDYRVGWGVADSPMEPVTSPEKGFIVLQKNGAAVATAHHSVVNVPGTDCWYVAYHRHALPDGNGYRGGRCPDSGTLWVRHSQSSEMASERYSRMNVPDRRQISETGTIVGAIASNPHAPKSGGLGLLRRSGHANSRTQRGLRHPA